MPTIPSDYLERVYAGLLGKNIGIRLGAPVEPAIWTYERIREVYGDITSYIKPYRNFAADDDANGPVYFVRPLLEKVERLRNKEGGWLGSLPQSAVGAGEGNPVAPLAIEPSEVARAWLDYSREGVGMFWWGGYGRSTEHTAYLNLKHGVPAPESGSIARNGKVTAEQIGGQIFIDTWGLVWPSNPEMAAEYAVRAASVSHDGEGLHGARFIAGCIAAAFRETDVEAVVGAGRAMLPADSAYAAVVDAVLRFHAQHPSDWRACQEYLLAEWGYDKWPGLCHIIPNAGVCVLALLYGKGSFARTVEIATMCGWDTDCNAGNVGTIAGVLYGLDALPAHYRAPVNDSIVLSGLPGTLNILDIPTFAKRVAEAGYMLAGEAVPASITEALQRGDGERAIWFDFVLPGSTHGMRVSDPTRFAARHRSGALEFQFERLVKEESGKLFFKPFYRRDDFDDERYNPIFSPIARPGQKVRIEFMLERWEGQSIGVEGYVRDTFTRQDIITTGTIFPQEGEPCRLDFQIPSLDGSFPDEIGLKITSFSGKGKRDSGRLFIRHFSIEGKASYTIDMAKQSVEFGCVTPFSHDGGTWSIESGRLHLMTPVQAASYTGGYRVGDQRITAQVRPIAGDCHMLLVRTQGATRGYWAGFDGPGHVAIYKNDAGFKRLANAEYSWQAGRDYVMAFEAIGSSICLSIDGEKVLEIDNDRFDSGMLGCGTLRASRALYGPFTVEEL